MTKREAKKIIRESLAPRYELARDSVIKFIIAESKRLRELREDFKKQSQSIDGKENPAWRKHYIGFYGYFDKSIKKQVEGSYYEHIPKIYRAMLEKTEKEIKTHYTKQYKETLKELVESIYNEIKAYNPTNIELGDSSHDINFILTNKAGKKQSYTINTIVAGGAIQIIHNRTLRKLHKGVVYE